MNIALEHQVPNDWEITRRNFERIMTGWPTPNGSGGGGGTVTAGDGLTLTGTTLDVGAGTGITVSASAVALAVPVAVASGGTGSSTATTARTSLGAAGYYSSATHGAGTTITITQATHGLRATRGLIVQVLEEATGAVEVPDIVVASGGDVTVTFSGSVSANTRRVTIVG